MADTDTVGSVDTKKRNKRKVEELSPAEDGSDFYCDLQSLMFKISKSFGVGGFLNAKMRKIETYKGLLTAQKDEWNFRDIIQNLPPEIQQRYTMELSLKSFKLLEILKRTILCFKRLNGGRKYSKDPAVDIYLKDIETKPMLPLPNRYIEIGLWKQVIQVNQQVCRRMDQLEKIQEHFAGNVEEESGKLDEERNLDKRGEEVVTACDKNKSFRDYYMEMVTAGFGDDLDRLRQEGTLNPRKVELLISCLETGTDIWSDLEKSLLQLSES